MGTPPPTREDITWLRELWGGPFMLKGDARIDSALIGLGRASVHDLVAGDVLVPPGFTRTLGLSTDADR